MPAWFQSVLDFITRYWVFLSIVAGILVAILVISAVMNARSRVPEEEAVPVPEPPAPKPEVVEAEVVNPQAVFTPEPAEVPPAPDPVPAPAPEPVPVPEPASPAPEVQAPQPEVQPEVPKPPKKVLGKYHVMYRSADDRWYVKREGSDFILRVLETQKEAYSWAIIKALPNDIGIVVHEKDGKIKKAQPL